MPSVNAIDKMVYRIKPTMQRTLLGPLILIKALEVEKSIVTDAAAVGEHAFTPGSLHVFDFHDQMNNR